MSGKVIFSEMVWREPFLIMPHCSCIVFIISPRQHAAANGCEVVSFLGMLTLMSVFLPVSCPNVWPRALARPRLPPFL